MRTIFALTNGFYPKDDTHNAYVEQKYAIEREKRLRPDFDAQYIKIHTPDNFAHFDIDPRLPRNDIVPGIKLSENLSISSSLFKVLVSEDFHTLLD